MSEIKLTINRHQYESYKPSGKVSWSRFGKQFLLAIAGTICVGLISALLYGQSYFPIFGPVLFSTPIYYLIYRVIRGGHCRNRFVGGLAGLCLMALFYASHWGWNYLAFILGHGAEEARQILQTECNQEGFWGFVNLIARKVVENDPFGPWFAYFLFIIEIPILFFLGYKAAKHFCQLAYYENYGKWASREVYYYGGEEKGEEVWDAIREFNWEALGTISKGNGLESGCGGGGVNLTIKHLPGVLTENIYIGLYQLKTHVIKNPDEKREKGFLRKLWDILFEDFVTNKKIRQLTVPAENAKGIEQYFPELRDPASYKNQVVVQYRDGIRGWLERRLYAGARITGPDFRESAVRESTEKVGQSPSRYEMLNADSSLCLPVSDDRPLEIKPLCWRMRISFWSLAVLLVLSGLCCGIAVLLGMIFLIDVIEILSEGYFLPLGIIFFCTVFLLSAVYIIRFHKKILLSMVTKPMRNRMRSLFDVEEKEDLILFSIEDTETNHVKKSIAEDIGICFPDIDNERLLIEGVKYRYVIRKQDIEKCEPWSGTKVIRVKFRVGASFVDMVLWQHSVTKPKLISPPQPILKAGVILGLFKLEDKK